MRNAASAILSLLLLAAPASAWAQGAEPAPAAAASQPQMDADQQASLFYLVLVGEIAAQTGQPLLASRELLEAAKQSQSPQLFERATEVAVAAGLGQQALEAVAAWREVEPDAVKPQAWQAKLLLELGRNDEAGVAIDRLIELTAPAQRGSAILSLLPTFERANDPQQALVLARRALAGSADLPQTWLVLGELEMRSGDSRGAFAHGQRALAADPGMSAAAALLLQNYKVDPQQADALLQPYFELHPDDSDLRLAWIGAALDQQRGSIALNQALALTRLQPELAEAWLFLGSVQLQQAQAQAAAASLQNYLDLPGNKPFRSRSMAAFGLSQAELKLGDVTASQRWLLRVPAGYDDQAVALQKALILVHQKRPQQAAAAIAKMPGATLQQQRDRQLALASLEQEQGHDERAWALLESGRKAYGDDSDYLYQAALMAERVHKPAEMEQLLRRALVRNPHDSAVLNALGYALADQNRHLGEAASLIAQALKLSPGNPFVMDSQGWLQFRQGRLDVAQQTLEQALAAQIDPEIQAHLAEVLWARGDHQRATELLRAAHDQAPGAEGVQSAMRHLGLQF